MKQGSQPSRLILHLGALGDFVAIVPCLTEIARGGDVTVLGPSPSRLEVALAPRGPVARAGTLPPGLFADELEPALAASLREFATVVAFTRDDGPLARNVRALGGFLVTPPPTSFAPHPGDLSHATDMALSGLRAHGLARADASPVPVLRATEDDLGRARERLPRGDFLAIAPGAGGRSKRWPASRFALVARAALSAGLEVVTLLGPAELDPPDPSLRLAGTQTLECPEPAELVGTLTLARAYLGNDSGVTHLAAALGTPVVALFGPTDARRWAPRGRGPVTVLEAPGRDLERLEASSVVESVKRALSG